MSGVNAFGTTFSFGGTPVGELTNITGPSTSAETIDVTSHDSTDGWMEFVAGLKNGGEVNLEGNYEASAGQNLGVGSSGACVITFKTTPGFKWTFDGIVTSFETSAPHDDKYTFSVTIKVNGKPVLVAV